MVVIRITDWSRDKYFYFVGKYITYEKGLLAIKLTAIGIKPSSPLNNTSFSPVEFAHVR